MSVSRQAALSFLGGIYAQQIAEAGLVVVDDAANFGPAIDEALLTLGTAYDDLATAEVESSDVVGYRALLRYFGLSRILDAVLERVNVRLGDPNVSKDRRQYVENLQKRLETLAAQAANYGLTSGPTWQSPTSINLDIYEPGVV